MKDLIEIATEEFIDKWNSEQNANIPYIKHKFDLRGKVAGQFWYSTSSSWFRWNLPVAEQNSDDYLVQTVGHEVAHHITRTVYPHATSHGWEWKNVMRQLGLEPARYHNYAVTPARIVKRPFKYLCPCGDTHKITATKFKNFVLRGLYSNGDTKYRCTNCNTRINIKEVKPI